MLMPSSSFALFLSFIAVGFAAAAAPGPSIMLLVSQSALLQQKDNVKLIIGLLFGSLLFATIAVSGIGMLITKSPLIFRVFKYAGVTLLVYLGGMRLLTSNNSLPIPVSGNKQLGLGLTTTLANPKIAIFYLVILPQFINYSAGHITAQYAILGATQLIIKLLVLIGYACLAVYCKTFIDRFIQGILTQRLLGMIYLLAAGLVLWLG